MFRLIHTHAKFTLGSDDSKNLVGLCIYFCKVWHLIYMRYLIITIPEPPSPPDPQNPELGPPAQPPPPPPPVPFAPGSPFGSLWEFPPSPAFTPPEPPPSTSPAPPPPPDPYTFDEPLIVDVKPAPPFPPCAFAPKPGDVAPPPPVPPVNSVVATDCDPPSVPNPRLPLAGCNPEPPLTVVASRLRPIPPPEPPSRPLPL